MHRPQGESYGGEERVVGDLRKRKAETRAATAGSDLLGQLVLRRVGFHELLRGAPVQKFDTPWTLARERRCRAASYHVVRQTAMSGTALACNVEF